jgi:hypothetical protein
VDTWKNDYKGDFRQKLILQNEDVNKKKDVGKGYLSVENIEYQGAIMKRRKFCT